ncbi:MAG: sigma-70 family RNA polymerase sigma factor [Planctomycetes bacterium]|nr:sigma-70 family RNA polymerase sigma factor [Planctomycetota bacterium]
MTVLTFDFMTEEARATLQELIEKARGGDRDALSELVNLHEPMLVRWARKRLGFPLRTLEDTRDIIHDTYAVVLRKIDQFQYEDSRSFARWLRGIVTRIVLQKANGAHIRRRLLMPDDAGIRDPGETPSTVAAAREATRHRYRVLREFERLDRFIYRLRMRGFSSLQIADHVGMTDRAVRMRFARVDAKLRLKLRSHLPERRDDEEV